MTCVRDNKWEAYLVVDKVDCWKSLHNSIQGARRAAGKEDSVVMVLMEEKSRIKWGRKTQEGGKTL